MKLILNKIIYKLTPQQHVFFGFLIYILLGFVLLCLPWLQKDTTIPVIDHLFMATSAVSTTGLVTTSLSDSYNFGGQFIVLLLIQIGGLGYLTFTTYFILKGAQKMTSWHKSILKTEYSLPSSISIRDFLGSIVSFTIIMEIIGAILYYIAFRQDGMDRASAMWSGVFHSVSSFCTAGFSLFNSSFTGYVDNTLVNITTAMLCICSSIGFIAIADIGLRIRGIKDHHLSFTTKIITIGTSLLIIIGFLCIYIWEPSVTILDEGTRIKAAFFHSMTAVTTAGFNSIAIAPISLAVILLTIFFMFIGASPSATSGGLTITTAASVFAIVKSKFKREKEVTLFKNVLPTKRLYRATATFVTYTSLIVLGTLILSFSEGFKLKEILFEITSALGTVGLSMGITADLTDFGKSIIMVLMFIGRVGVLTFGLAFWSKDALTDNKTENDKTDLAV